MSESASDHRNSHPSPQITATPANGPSHLEDDSTTKASPTSLSRPNYPWTQRRSSRSFSDEPSHVIGNAFNFFRGKPDPKESRYASDEEEAAGDMYMPFSGQAEHNDEADIDEAAPVPLVAGKEAQDRHQFTQLALKLPNFFGRTNLESAPPNQTDDVRASTNLNPRKLFTMFRKKNKDKDRRQEDGAEDGLENAALDVDAEARERAVGLISSLSLGSPAINLLASCLCEDEYGIARAPLLLNLLGIKVFDISNSPFTKNRKFHIELEYGVLPQRLKWSVEKTAKDLLYLHSRFKLLVLRGTFKSEELPRYPVPPLLKRNDRKTGRKSGRSKSIVDPRADSRTERIESRRDNRTEPIADTTTERTDALPGTLDPVLDQRVADNSLDPRYRSLLAERLEGTSLQLPNRDTHGDNHSIASNMSFRDRLSTLQAHFSNLSSVSSIDSTSPEQVRNRMLNNQKYVNEITKYLNDLTQACAMKPQSNRLFHFFEISPISALLSYETGYTGKQGVIHIGGTARSQGWRVGHFKANDLKGMIDRRSEKWFLVRNTYLMYVSNINSTVPLEVFLIDPSFKIHCKGENENNENRGYDTESDIDEEYVAGRVGEEEKNYQHVLNKVFKHLRIVLENNERKLVMIPKSYKEHNLWVLSINKMIANNPWAEPHRFNSFAPIRKNCFAQWFVDARDYFWAVSSAIEMAKDVIFIHDWWLSPELYLRRPANGNQQFRIDRLLQRKAMQGVKVFVIVYRNVGSTVPIDSLYTKHSVLSLNQENIHVIRSPNQLLQNTFFWAHHEKVCIIDYTVAFMGGIDLCYGRYDTPDHVLTDDSQVDFDGLDKDTLTKDEFSKFRVFPGKDYSNTRVKDFNNLDKPYESMYDRNIVPRMPWHDVHMVTSGETARDLSRHFVQRWNYLLRQKRPSRLTPLLTPPPDLTPEEVADMGLDGSCEIQILRSAGSWSLGLKEHEESIHQAYLKLIEESEHFVYIENQFFVTSCVIDGTEIKNRIGDALVDRIVRAHKEGTTWKAVILIPLVPGFEAQVDEPDGSSVRVVMQCEYMSISRGSSSLFAKLRKFGIDPDNYIQFFSLRKWGAIGPDRSLVTEQLYIHAKTMIVDDRVAIIGSANINERSMRGSRDSEVAAVVRDSETIKSTMNGEPYTVGRFPHTLRMRLMREHLGVSVDVLDVVERKFDRFESFAKTEDGLKAASNCFKKRANLELSAAIEYATREVLGQPSGSDRWKYHCDTHGLSTEVITVPDDIRSKDDPTPEAKALPLSFNNRTGPHEANRGIREKKKHSYDTRVQQSVEHKTDVFGEGVDKYRTNLGRKARLDSNRFLKELSQKVMGNQPTDVFLPGVEDMLSFLELDDHEFQDDMDERVEEILAARNKERWMLLKKVAYLQRMGARATHQAHEEDLKRAAAGFPTRNGSHSSNVKKDSKNNEGARRNGEATEEANGVSSIYVAPAELGQRKDPEGTSPGEVAPKIDALDKEYPERDLPENGHMDANTESIPIIRLDEQQLKDHLRQVELMGLESGTKFIDPYGFEDPLDPDFYEDLWFESARKNTDLFRLVFHCQPDDFVANWKDYKQFMKLADAFKLAQAEEARNRREKFRFESESSFESERPNHHHTRKNSQTISLSSYSHENGILGEIPSRRDRRNLKRKGRRFLARDPIIEGDNEYDSEDEPEEYTDAEDLNGEEANGDLTDEDTPHTSPSENSPDSSRSREAHADPITASQAKNFNTKKRRAGTFSARRRIHSGDRIFDRDTSQRLLEEIQGHLVLFPVDWLARELEGGNWFFNTDRIPPIEIYD